VARLIVWLTPLGEPDSWARVELRGGSATNPT
jgi:hypothetical protein